VILVIGPKNWARSQENAKNIPLARNGVAHAFTIGDIPSLERFRVHPNGKSQFPKKNR